MLPQWNMRDDRLNSRAVIGQPLAIAFQNSENVFICQ